ncbi:hypothetical protein NS228_06300 [Methylobacterium indicum]|uniref:hypothetical protein n=1 Tax=Methylobacterium indicum TaxID=1775910 RepID=UPI0007346E0C|nr:hypothetical protein [Methylobacterium indicum]KTS30844.1 hypothetical protein NS229_14530 [Methylobacterium indicum]KTS41568.1 hypothetical protein NS228_06300 [Methylobacterium indicum]KTS45183.1 hypothetical protein NS230_24290 [Methylobacterium indicum]
MSAAPLTVPTTTLATLCGISPRRVQQLQQEGVFASETHGQWNALVCVPAFITHRVAQEHANTAARTGGAAERHQSAKAKQVEMRTAREEHRLIETAEALAVVDEIVATAKTAFAGLPPRVTRDLALRETIEGEIANIFDRLGAQFARRASELRAGGEAAAPPDPDEPAAAVAAPKPKPTRRPSKRKPAT